jgi:hypothetical protein
MLIVKRIIQPSIFKELLKRAVDLAINAEPDFLFEVVCMSLRPLAPSVILARINEDSQVVLFVS